MIRLKEAITRAKKLGLIKRKSDLAREIWKESSSKGAYINLVNLERGKTKKLDLSVLPLVCQRLGVTPEYLLGMSDNPSAEDFYDAKEKAKKIIEIAQSI